jgi:hypothetical protein
MCPVLRQGDHEDGLIFGDFRHARLYPKTDHRIANVKYIQGRSVVGMIADAELTRPDEARDTAAEVLAASLGVA